MTYCLAIRVSEGLVALADGRVTSGSQVGVTRKLTMRGRGANRYFIMTSGLRSVRDKVMSYLPADPPMADVDIAPFARVGDVAQAVGAQVRRVAAEDRETLEAAQLPFNLHALVGGRLADDPAPSVFLVYPEGNWIEIDERQPYLSIGATAYGKPILDRALRYDTPLRHALKLAYLSFDSSRFSSADVGFPIDMATLTNGEADWRFAQLDYDELVEQRQWWNRHIGELAQGLPDTVWVDRLIAAPAHLAVVRRPDEAG